MLEMRETCERCATPLPMDSDEARICSYECTFCGPCVDGPQKGAAPIVRANYRSGRNGF